MDQTGWVKLFRAIQEWEWYKVENMEHLYLHLIMNANRSDCTWRGVGVKRGDVVTGLFSLSERTGISVQSIRTCLNRLKSTGEITVKSTNKFTIITVCKYEDYQYENIEPNKHPNKQLTNQLTTVREEEKIEKKENKEKNKELFDFVPEDWKPLWSRWIKYRQEIKKPFKSEDSLKTNFKQLVKLSGNNLGIAEQIIEQSIGNQYVGIFELKKYKNQSGGFVS
jgi:hypothetical protein